MPSHQQKQHLTGFGILKENAKKVVIIVPTYNERENIEALIEKLQIQFETMPHHMHILVVDDHSPDGTAAIVRQRQTRYPNLHRRPPSPGTQTRRWL